MKEDKNRVMENKKYYKLNREYIRLGVSRTIK